MQIKFLGAHNCESRDTRNVSLLVDGILALDAGALTSALTFEEQSALQAVLITHSHYDHVRDIPALAINLYFRESQISVYTHQDVYQSITQSFLNGRLYSEFHKTRNEAKASLNFHIIRANQSFHAAAYQVLAVPVKHSIPALGYQVSSTGGCSFFYTGDTGPGLAETWARVSPRVLIIEVTAANRWQTSSLLHGHLTPALLESELISFRQIKGYLPRVITLHTNPADETQIRFELTALSSSLEIPVETASEGMQVDI